MAAAALSEADQSWRSLTWENLNAIYFASIIATAARTRLLVDEVSLSHLGQTACIREVTIE